MDTRIEKTYSECDLYSLYDDFLDECYGDTVVAGASYSTSYALKELDPIAYRCGFVDWLDAEGYREHPTEDDTYYLESECDEYERDYEEYDNDDDAPNYERDDLDRVADSSYKHIENNFGDDAE